MSRTEHSPTGCNRRDAELAAKGFVRLRELAAELGCDRSALTHFIRKQIWKNRFHYDRGRQKGGGGREYWVHKERVLDYLSSDSGTGPITDTGGTWWMPADTAGKAKFSRTTPELICDIVYKRSAHPSFAKIKVKTTMIQRGPYLQQQPNGKWIWVRIPKRPRRHVHEVALLEINKAIAGTNGLVTTNGLMEALKLTRSFVKEKAGKLWHVERHGTRNLHDLEGAKEAMGRLNGSTSILSESDVLKARPHITVWLLRELKKTKKHESGELHIESKHVYGHARPGFRSDEMDRLEAWEKERYEHIHSVDDFALGNLGHLERNRWTSRGDGKFCDPVGQEWTNRKASRRLYKHSRKILDNALTMDEPSLGRRIARKFIEHVVRDRNGRALIVFTEVFWTDDQQRMADRRDLLLNVRRLGVYRDSEGLVHARAKVLGLAKHVTYRRRKKDETMEKVSLFGPPEYAVSVPDEQVTGLLKRIGIESVDQLPLFPETAKNPVPPPLIALEHRVPDSDSVAQNQLAPTVHHKKRNRGRPEVPRGRLCYEARMNGLRWQSIGDEHGISASNAQTYAVRFASLHSLPWPPPKLRKLVDINGVFRIEDAPA